MMVVVIMGVVAVTVIPAMDNLREMREGAARDDVARMLEMTKGHALASGEPFGLRVDTSDSVLTMVQVSNAGGIVNTSDPLTGMSRSLILSQVYPDVTLGGFVNGDGASGPGIIWFDYEAYPHTRNINGVFTAINDEPAIITLSSSATVVVHAYSGLVETP